jgi:HSP20 family protein
MDYIKIRFGNDLEAMGSSFDHSLEHLFRPRPVSPMFSSRERNWVPQMDIIETPEEVIVLAEIAGVEKDNLEVEINSKAVRIFGRRSELPLGEKSTYRLAEIQYGQFERILFLPAPIDPEVVSSSYSNGFLRIHLAKQPRSKTHKIPISDD